MFETPAGFLSFFAETISMLSRGLQLGQRLKQDKNQDRTQG